MKKLFLAALLALTSLSVFAQAAAPVPTCMWSSGVNRWHGGVVVPPVVIVSYWCAPYDEYGIHKNVLAVARLDLLNDDMRQALQSALLNEDDLSAYELRTHSLDSPELAPYIAQKRPEIEATTPPPTWVVRKNGTSATRVAYAHAASAPALGARSTTVTAPVGMGCYCANPAYRFNSGTSIYCPFAASVDQWRKRQHAGADLVTICEKAK